MRLKSLSRYRSSSVSISPNVVARWARLDRVELKRASLCKSVNEELTARLTQLSYSGAKYSYRNRFLF